MTEQSNPHAAPEFIAEHDGPEVYIPLAPGRRSRSLHLMEETARRLGFRGEDRR